MAYCGKCGTQLDFNLITKVWHCVTCNEDIADFMPTEQFFVEKRFAIQFQINQQLLSEIETLKQRVKTLEGQ